MIPRQFKMHIIMYVLGITINLLMTMFAFITDFGDKELTLVVQHFSKTLKPHLKLDDGADATEEVLAEWRILKRLLHKRFI